MSHTRRKPAKKNDKYTVLLHGTLFLCLFTLLDMLSGHARAAVNPGTQIHKNASYTLQSSLKDMTHQQNVILDWRTQSFEFNFDLPANEWYEMLSLHLSASPKGNVSNTSPLLVSYNGAKPVELNSYGSRFDAQIRLDASQIRPFRNSIIISYKTPSEANCLSSMHGQWTLDFSRSKLIAKARKKPRATQLAEIEKRLSHPMTAPKRVAIIARGKNKIALEALTAQGIGQRVKSLPNFQFNTSGSDFTVIIGTPERIRPFIKNKSMLEVSGATIFVDTGTRPKLVISAKNETMLMQLTRAFASYHLPNVARHHATLQSLYSGVPLSSKPTLTAQNFELSDIGDMVLPASWRPETASVKFNVQDARTSSAKLILKIVSSKNIDPQSRLNVRLNEQSIGYTYLNKVSKNVSFNIKQGQFKAANNTLSVEPVLNENGENTACATQTPPPAIMISSNSKLTVSTANPAPPTELNRFAASGTPFNAPNDTVIVLTARSDRDRASTLKFLGFAAQQFGPQWSQAVYETKMPQDTDIAKNILMIGPNIALDPSALKSAPSALTLAFKGKAVTGPQQQKLAAFPRHASLDTDETFKMAARNISAQARVNSGGIAALFPSPFKKGKFIGVISATSPARFSSAMKSITNIEFWNAFQGSVVRWNKRAVLMAQTTIPVPQSFYPAQPKQPIFAKLKTMKTSTTNVLAGMLPQTNKKPKHKPAQESPITLRGAAVVPVIVNKPQTTKLQTIPISSTFDEMVASGTNTFTSIKTSFMKLRTHNQSVRTFKNNLGGLTNNYAFWLIILGFAGFILIGLASPKSARPR